MCRRAINVELAVKAATQAANLVDVAIKAYAFSPTSYTMDALHALLRIAKMLEEAGIEIDDD